MDVGTLKKIKYLCMFSFSKKYKTHYPLSQQSKIFNESNTFAMSKTL